MPLSSHYRKTTRYQAVVSYMHCTFPLASLSHFHDRVVGTISIYNFPPIVSPPLQGCRVKPKHHSKPFLLLSNILLKHHTKMALHHCNFLVKLAILVSLVHFALAARQLSKPSQDQEKLAFEYHNGPLLSGEISINLIWYGKFKPSERAIISDFIASLSSSPSSANPTTNQPSVSTWWKTTEKYYHQIKSKKSSPLILSMGTQILDEKYSLGKSLSNQHIKQLASKGEQKNAINVALTASDVAVEGFCSSRCGTHGSSLSSKAAAVKGKIYKFAYIWVGNSVTQCPGQCAWPFHQPIYGPQAQPLVAPNNNVGLDGMVINLASLLAGTVTNPFGNGYFQGPADAPLEAASACTGIYGNGAYPGYAGKLLVDTTTGASYNAHGANGRKYLLPALIDPSTSACSTLV